MYYNNPQIISRVKTKVQEQNPGNTKTEMSIKGEQLTGNWEDTKRVWWLTRRNLFVAYAVTSASPRFQTGHWWCSDSPPPFHRLQGKWNPSQGEGENHEDLTSGWPTSWSRAIPHLLSVLGMYTVPMVPTAGVFQECSLERVRCYRDYLMVYVIGRTEGFSVNIQESSVSVEIHLPVAIQGKPCV